ncbi:MAG: hypothetical protein KIT80_16120 [Chitinophagaceae bacterium]|nr:hypothetical protein [Chitinophagaceae bacterium]MCW5928443.1 hypothetical protein [Chitinophagaceae bacterium]
MKNMILFPIPAEELEVMIEHSVIRALKNNVLGAAPKKTIQVKSPQKKTVKKQKEGSSHE